MRTITTKAVGSGCMDPECDGGDGGGGVCAYLCVPVLGAVGSLKIAVIWQHSLVQVDLKVPCVSTGFRDSSLAKRKRQASHKAPSAGGICAHSRALPGVILCCGARCQRWPRYQTGEMDCAGNFSPKRDVASNGRGGNVFLR